MSVRTSVKQTRRRPVFDLVAASIGVLLATGWFVGSKRAALERQNERATRQLQGAEKTVEHYFAAEGQRLLGAVRLLAGDQRLRQSLLDAIDEPTLVDSFKDLEPLDGIPVHAVLTPEGKVAAVVGAPAIRGLDLSSTAVVRAAVQSDTAGTARWFIDGKLTEVAVASVRRGGEVKALVMVGAPLNEAGVKALSAATGVVVAVASEGKVTLSSSTAAVETTALAAIASGSATDVPPNRVVDVPNTVPPARVILLREPNDTSDEAWRWGPLGGALLFAVLAVVRAGR